MQIGTNKAVKKVWQISGSIREKRADSQRFQRAGTECAFVRLKRLRVRRAIICL